MTRVMAKTKQNRGDALRLRERTYAAMRDRHRDEERQLVGAVLQQHKYSLTATAHELAVSISTLQTILKRHPELERAQREKGPGKGNPQFRLSGKRNT